MISSKNPTVNKVKDFTNFENIHIEVEDGNNCIFCYEEVTSTIRTVKQLDCFGRPLYTLEKEVLISSTVAKRIKLFEISSETLSKFRSTTLPSFVLKDGEKLYFAIIPDNISFLSVENMFSEKSLNNHKCSSGNYCCLRLSAYCDEKGGCAKVRGHATGIERYPFITCGYETFNTRRNCFVVANCNNEEVAKVNT